MKRSMDMWTMTTPPKKSILLIDLYPYQLEAVEKLHNGAILCGGVGSGKSRTALAYYYFEVCDAPMMLKGPLEPPKAPRDLYIITTAKKRDSLEWLNELGPFCLTSDPELNHGHIQVTIDSWNNIKKYKDVARSFFIFDEQRVVGSGAWVKTFLNITRKNQWILLSATPGDVWSDYIPVFVANGFYKNKTEFMRRHAIMNPYTKFPKIEKYVETERLIRLRRSILVNMHQPGVTEKKNHILFADYNKKRYETIFKERWNPYDDEPIEESGKLCYLLRRVVNEDQSRRQIAEDLILMLGKVIVFYNFTYELNILREIAESNGIPFSEWNGEKHQEIPETNKWVYLVQYAAGAEGWNCIKTDSIIFYSQNYSYRMTHQAAGRIDRVNTPFKELHYYYIRSRAPIDEAIYGALSNKRNFNEKQFLEF